MANQPRSPIVAILGHVDHGKTTLLDYIRKSNITGKEFGGITQKIGAYEINTDFKDYPTSKITFIDTPGHEAFSRLRARGSQIADIAILLVDGKDSLMPQTVESIAHIKAAGIPFLIAVNKMDLPDVNPAKVKTDLMKHNVLVEGQGGNVPVALVSAKTGKGIKELLETLLLMSADLKLAYVPSNPAKAYIVETKKDRRGIVVSCIIKDGVIRVGDTLFSDNKKIKVRSLFNDTGIPVKEVAPSTPFEILGFEELPEVGSPVTGQLEIETPVTGSETGQAEPESVQTQKTINMEELLHPAPVTKKLSLVIKTDSFGSLEALNHTLEKNKDITIILSAVGEINQSDVFLAKSTKSIVIGFSVKPNKQAEDLAKQEKVVIKTYDIIYELLDELTEVSQLIKEKEEREKNLKGEAKVVATFVVENEKIYGVRVNKGKLNLGDDIQVFRKNKLFGKTKLVSLKTRAKKIDEIKKDQEAGMIFSPRLDITIGDMVKSIL